MANDRHAGRKPKLNDAQLNIIIGRKNSGESIASLAKEYGISRQALSKRIKDKEHPSEIQMDYYVGDILYTKIILDKKSWDIRLINYTDTLSLRAFGHNTNPNRYDLQNFLDEYYLRHIGVTSYDELVMSDNEDTFDIINNTSRQPSSDTLVFNDDNIPKFYFSKKDRVIARTDTDGYQIKGITSDHRYFVKSQAIISGTVLRDYAVEIIASDICEQLSIPHVSQSHCKFVYNNRSFDGVYSDNFEYDGYTFLSFERLLSRHGYSTRDEAFISLDALDKLKWCASKLSEIGSIPYDDTLKYMLDLAVVDCLVGNVDRHTKNFGLFYNINASRYEIPLIFDNGMGLFEHDPYRDTYKTFDEAMRNVYVSPYGEDPFDMIDMLDKEFDLMKLYPELSNISYKDDLSTPFALEYERRMLSLCQK